MTTSRSTRLDINTASPEALAAVPGLDAALVALICTQRPYKKVKELLRLPGFDLSQYELAAPHLRVGQPRAPRSAAAGAPRPRRPKVVVAPVVAAEPAPSRPDPVAEVTAPPPSLRARWSEPLNEFPAIVLEAEMEPRPLIQVQPAARAVVPLTARVNTALFESYAGPRLMFALLALTLTALGVGWLSGQIHFGSAAALVVAAAPPQVTAAPSATAPSAAALSTAPLSPSATAIPEVVATTASPATAVAAAAAVAAVTASPVFVSSPGLANTGQQIFNETFVPAGYWSTGDNDLSQRSIVGNQLVIRMKVPGSIAWVVNGYAADNFYYQGTLRMGACQLGDYAGLVFRAKNDGSLYLFGLSCDGRYRLLRHVGGDFQTLVDFTFTPEAVAGSNASNLLAVRAEGALVSLYVNDKLLIQKDVGAGGPASGLFGVFAKSATTANLQVGFSDLSAWALAP